MESQKLLLIFALTVSHCQIPVLQTLEVNTGNPNYSADEAWPHVTTVQSLQAYGSGIAVDKRNYSKLIILHRSTSMQKSANLTASNGHDFIMEDVIMILDPGSGKIVASWGGDKFVRPHGIEVTDEGDLFITDVRLHQVFKFLPSHDNDLWENQPHFILGERFVSGNDPHHFCSPADVAVIPVSGEIFIADGYCNFRIVKFNRDGLYLQEFGAGPSEPNLPPVIPFNVTHAVSIAMPHKNSKSDLPVLVFVADRNNGRIQCFTENGTFLYEIGHENFGTGKNMIFSLDLTSPSNSNPYGVLFAINGNLLIGQSAVFEVKVSHLDFEVISSFPISIPSNHSAPERTEIPHDITVTPDGSAVYVIEAYKTLTVKKFTRSMAASEACPSRSYNFLKNLNTMIAVSAILLNQCK